MTMTNAYIMSAMKEYQIPMVNWKKAQIERRLKKLGLRLEKQVPPRFVEDSANGHWHARWIIRPDTIGSCMAREVIPLRRLADAEDVIDVREIMQP